MRRLFLLLVVSFFVPGVFLGNTSAEIIDFEGLPAGTKVSEVFGDSGSGPIGVSGTNPTFPTGYNAAIIFDSSTPTGEDYDLGTPNEDFGGPGIGDAGKDGSPYENNTALGNVLIVAEDLNDGNSDGLVDDPDDAEGLVDSSITLDFSALGSVTVNSITIIDFEAREPEPKVELFDPFDVLLASFYLPHTDDNGVAVKSLGPTAGVAKMVVTLNGSGAIDNIVFSLPSVGDEGCTPGYWKQEQHFGSWTRYTPSTTFFEVFGCPIVIKWSEGGKPGDTADPTLLQTLQAKGGGINALARHAVAAWLNAANPDVDYAFTTFEVIALFQGAYDSGDFESTKEMFEEANEASCPLGRSVIDAAQMTSPNAEGS
jgi:hypothetical protein